MYIHLRKKHRLSIDTFNGLNIQCNHEPYNLLLLNREFTSDIKLKSLAIDLDTIYYLILSESLRNGIIYKRFHSLAQFLEKEQ